MFLIAVLLAGLPIAASQCDFPSELTGNWVSSTLSTLTFTSDTVGPFFQNEKTMECYTNEGQKYLLRSAPYSAGPVVFVDYTCLDIKKVTTTTFHYFELTPPNSDPVFNDERKVVKLNTSDVTVEEVCLSDVPTHPAAFSFMMKEGSLSSSVVSFPSDVLGEFNVKLAGCDEGASLDVCTDNTRLDFNYSLCGASPFSDQMIFHAVYSETHNHDEYVTLYIEVDPPEPENPFIPFSCMAVGGSDGNLSLTIAPGNCQQGQDSVNVTDPGIAMELFKTDVCDVPTTEAATTTSGTVVTTADETAVTNSSAITSAPAVVDGSTTEKNTASWNAINVLTVFFGLVAAMWNI